MSKKKRDVHAQEEIKREFLRLYDIGLRGHVIAKRLRLSPRFAECWCHTIRAVGREKFLIVVTHMKYSYEIMLAAVKAVVEEGEASRDVMARYGITGK